MKLIGSILLVSCIATAAFPQPCSSLKQTHDEAGLRKVESLWLDALLQKDQRTLQCLLGDQFVDTTWSGEIHDRTVAIATVAVRPNIHQQVDIERVQIFDDTGVVWGVNRISAPDSHQLLMRIRFTDIFRYEDGRWIAVAAQETPER